MKSLTQTTRLFFRSKTLQHSKSNEGAEWNASWMLLVYDVLSRLLDSIVLEIQSKLGYKLSTGSYRASGYSLLFVVDYRPCFCIFDRLSFFR
jgi:hypothetical protein